MNYPVLSASQIHFIELSSALSHDAEQFKTLERISQSFQLGGCAVRFVSEPNQPEFYGLIHRSSNSLFSNFPHIPTKISLKSFHPIEWRDQICVFSGDYYCDFRRENFVGAPPPSGEVLYLLNSASVYMQPPASKTLQPIEVYDIDKIGTRNKVHFSISQAELKKILDIYLSDLSGKIKNRHLGRLIRYRSYLCQEPKYQFVGDLVQAKEADIKGIHRLGQGAVNAVNDYLARISDGKLKLGLHISGWSRPS